MKKISFFSLLFLLIVQTGSTQTQTQLRSKTDERFELTSTIFALAEADEYNQTQIPAYRADIEKYFAKFKNHPVVEYARYVRQTQGVAYAAVSTTADMLQIQNGRITLQPRYDIAQVIENDSRWDEYSFNRYLQLLNDFYRKSKFHKFYEAHADLYHAAEFSLNGLLKEVKSAWFASFYGKPYDPNFQIFVSLINGPSNYMIPDGILIGTAADRNGNPQYFPQFLSVVIHEINHHYANPLAEAAWPELKAAAEKIYPHVAAQMAQMAYGSAREMTGEWLNNLFMLMYYRENEPRMVNYFTAQLVNNGFIWMGRSVALMDEFYADRSTYPTIDAFMPRIVAFYNETGDTIEQFITARKANIPRIISVSPELNSSLDGVSEIVVTFSQPMLESLGFRGPTPEKGNNLRNLLRDTKWSDDHRQVRLLIDASKAKPDAEYRVELFHDVYSTDFIRLSEEGNELIYHTGRP